MLLQSRPVHTNRVLTIIGVASAVCLVAGIW